MKTAIVFISVFCAALFALFYFRVRPQIEQSKQPTSIVVNMEYNDSTKLYNINFNIIK